MPSVSYCWLHGKASSVLCVLSLLSLLYTPASVSASSNHIGAAAAGNAGTSNTVLILDSTTGNAAGSSISSCPACASVTGDAKYGNTWEACAQQYLLSYTNEVTHIQILFVAVLAIYWVAQIKCIAHSLASANLLSTECKLVTFKHWIRWCEAYWNIVRTSGRDFCKYASTHTYNWQPCHLTPRLWVTFTDNLGMLVVVLHVVMLHNCMSSSSLSQYDAPDNKLTSTIWMLQVGGIR